MRHLLTLAILFTATIVSAQTTRIVDHNFNAPTGPHIYSTLQAAADAANPGDTIQVQPSPTTYGNIVINKPLVLVGIGFNLVKDLPLSSSMGTITLTNNADNTTTSSGTVITGLKFTYLYPGVLTGASYILENVVVYNCRFSYAFTTSSYAQINNLEIYDCYVVSQYTSDAAFYFSNLVTNSLIRNNLMLYGVYFGSTTPGTNTITNNIIYGRVGVRALGTNTNIINNNFIGVSNTQFAFLSYLSNCIVSYNIFFGPTPSIAAAGSTSSDFQQNVFSFNLVHAAGDQTWPPTGGGVGNSGSPNYTGSPLFANVQLLDTWSGSYDFTLDPSSPALLTNIPDDIPGPPLHSGALFDIGITGGAYPWTESNFSLQTTALPIIEVLNTSTIINPGDDLPVHIKIKSN